MGGHPRRSPAFAKGVIINCSGVYTQLPERQKATEGLPGTLPCEPRRLQPTRSADSTPGVRGGELTPTPPVAPCRSPTLPVGRPPRAPPPRSTFGGCLGAERACGGGGGYPEPEEAAVPRLGHPGRQQWDARSRGGGERVHPWDRPGFRERGPVIRVGRVGWDWKVTLTASEGRFHLFAVRLGKEERNRGVGWVPGETPSSPLSGDHLWGSPPTRQVSQEARAQPATREELAEPNQLRGANSIRQRNLSSEILVK